MTSTVEAIVEHGRVVLENLPFDDGTRVEVNISAHPRPTIDEVRKEMAGRARYADFDPSEPMIPIEEWEMLK